MPYSLPDDVEPYKRTRAFTQASVPSGLLADHTTRDGVWGRIVVVAGELDYIIGDETIALSPGIVGIIPPTVPHRVAIDGEVEFFVEFLR